MKNSEKATKASGTEAEGSIKCLSGKRAAQGLFLQISYSRDDLDLDQYWALSVLHGRMPCMRFNDLLYVACTHET